MQREKMFPPRLALHQQRADLDRILIMIIIIVNELWWMDSFTNGKRAGAVSGDGGRLRFWLQADPKGRGFPRLATSLL